MSTNRIARILTTLALAAAAALTACAEKVTPPVDDGSHIPAQQNRALTAEEQRVVTTSLAFGFGLMREVAATESKPNLMLSPLSASVALGMALDGASGHTFDAMRATLGYADLSDAQINAAYSGLIAQLRARDPKVQFALANSMWYERTFAVLPAFTDALRTNFEADVAPLDFAAASSPETISDWASQKTAGRIKDLITHIDAGEVMFLVNAVYFKGPWNNPFDRNSTHDAAFTRLDGTTTTVPMMSHDGSCRSVSDGTVQAAELFYGDSAYSMVLLAPAGSAPLSSINALLAPDRWNTLIASMRPGRVMVTMPKFSFDYGTLLNQPLTSLGMGIAFDPQRAEFARIASTGGLYISRVQQKTFIKVDEQGTEAAAATSVGVGVVSLPPQVTFNRAFYFAIRERSTGAILFLGRVGDPGAA